MLSWGYLSLPLRGAQACHDLDHFLSPEVKLSCPSMWTPLAPRKLRRRHLPATVPSLGCGLHHPSSIGQHYPLCLLGLFLLLGGGVREVWVPLLGGVRGAVRLGDCPPRLLPAVSDSPSPSPHILTSNWGQFMGMPGPLVLRNHLRSSWASAPRMACSSSRYT